MAYDRSTLDGYNKQLLELKARRDGLGLIGADGDYSFDGGRATDDQIGQINNLDSQIASINQLMTAEQHRANMAAQGLNEDGSPIKKDFDSLIDPATGLLKKTYQLEARPDIAVDQRAIDEIRGRAFEKGDSAWARLALNKQALEEKTALDNSRAQSAGAQAQTLAALMQRGGVSSGSRERMGSRAARDQAMAAQGVYSGGAKARADIGLQDQTQKNDFLKAIPGLDFQNAQVANANRDYQTNVQKTNIGAALADIESKRNFDMGTYQEQMKKWAADQSSQVAQRSGGGKK